jgi:hypothetical protein
MDRRERRTKLHASFRCAVSQLAQLLPFMEKTRTASSPSRSSRRYRQRTAEAELPQVIRAIQELTLELAELRDEERSGSELEAKELELEQLRWQLAALARRVATDESGAAA